jgi:hypothetical protein
MPMISTVGVAVLGLAGVPMLGTTAVTGGAEGGRGYLLGRLDGGSETESRSGVRRIGRRHIVAGQEIGKRLLSFARLHFK